MRPKTLWLGLGIILLCEVFLLVDVVRRGGIVVPEGPLPAPDGRLGGLARWIAVNMTGLCWVAYLFVIDGVLTILARRKQDRLIASIRTRPHRFALAALTGIPVWCYFDWINFQFMDAWRYHGLPDQWWQRWIGYFVAFAAISPGMFLAAQFYQFLGLKRLQLAARKSRTRDTGSMWPTVVRINLPIQIVVLLLGVTFTLYPVIVGDPIGNMTLWVSLMFLLDPVNHWLGGESIIGDWRDGRFGRTVALMVGGATCGFLWEFWNYWAVAKWTYNLPFLGVLEQYRYFEMPWLGFQGFLPFAIECWVVFNFFLILAGKMNLRIAEPLPDEHAII